ncbi:MAG TPA: hypothetical protein VN961_20840, partial [Streptosporangiaceae bacterium]|nr:hypothetical protein [Streptosporangiaceae bacterium]
MDTTVDAATGGTAAFFDLDKTLISRSSTLAFVPSFYRYGLISGVQAVRGALAQIVFRLGGADHKRMEKIKNQVSKLCCGWPVLAFELRPADSDEPAPGSALKPIDAGAHPVSLALPQVATCEQQER